MKLSSPEFEQKSFIPNAIYLPGSRCKSGGWLLRYSEKAKAWLLVDDPDAPGEVILWHWVLYDIPVQSHR